MEISAVEFEILSVLDSERCWEVRAFGDVWRDYDDDVPRIEVLFREFEERGRGMRGPCERQTLSIPFYELAGLPLGSVWKGRRRIGENERELKEIDLQIGPPENGVESLAAYLNASMLTKAGFAEETLDELLRSRCTRHPILGSSKHLASKHVLLPSVEVYRQTFGVASDFSEAIFNHQLINDVSLRTRLSLDDSPTIRLSKFMLDSSAPLFAHYILSPAMQRSAHFLAEQYINDYIVFGGRAPLSVLPAFDYPIRISVRGRTFPAMDRGCTFFARQLVAADVEPLAPERLNVDRDHPVPTITSVVSDEHGDSEGRATNDTTKSKDLEVISDAEPANAALSVTAIGTQRGLFGYLDKVVIEPIYARTPCVRSSASSDTKDPSPISPVGVDGTTAPARSYGSHRPINLSWLENIHLQRLYEFRYLRKLIKHLLDLPNVSTNTVSIGRTISSDLGSVCFFVAKIHSGTFPWAVMDRDTKQYRQCLVLDIQKGEKHLYLFEPQLRNGERRCMRVFASPDMSALPPNKLFALLHAFTLTKAMSVSQAMAGASAELIPAVIASNILGLSERRFEHAETKGGGPARVAERIVAFFDGDALPASSIIQRSDSEDIKMESTF